PPAPPSSPSSLQEELPSPDEQVPSQPQPQAEQDPSPGDRPGDGAEHVTDRRPSVVIVHHPQAFPGHEGADDHRPPDHAHRRPAPVPRPPAPQRGSRSSASRSPRRSSRSRSRSGAGTPAPARTPPARTRPPR